MTGTIYTLDQWEIDIRQRELRANGVLVPLGDRAFEVLEVLAESAGCVVTKSDLMTRIWPGAIVGENTLQVHVSSVRRALGTDRALLRTSSGRGYLLAGDWALQADRIPRDPLTQMHRVRCSARGNLPLDGSKLIGRAAAIGRLRDLISANRVVTLVGPGGIGKTRLALATARGLATDYPDGAWLVDLASLSDPTLVASTVAATLGLGGNGEDLSAMTIAQILADRQLLLVLDNCEHLINAAANLIEMIVRASSGTSILATSRELLRIDGEYGYWVPPLEVPAEDVLAQDAIEHSAVQLFLARAQASLPGTSIRPSDLAAITAICRHLDGVPLAIELASACASALGLHEVLTRLNDRFTLLRNGRRNALPRHQTLRATLDWSYELLPPDEQLYLRRLSVFSASFNLQGGAAVAGDTADTGHRAAEIITSLVTKSLISVEQTEGPGLWRLLETTRAYGLDRLQESGEFGETARRHAGYILSLLRPPTVPSGEGPQKRALDPDQNLVHDLRASLDWAFSSSGDITLAIALTTAAVPLWLSMSLLMECRNNVQRMLNGLAPGIQLSVEDRLQLCLALGISLLSINGVVQETRAALHQALHFAASLGDVDHELQALWALWTFHSNNGENLATEAVARRFLELAPRSTTEADEFVGKRLMGVTMHYRGRQDEARRHLERVIGLYVPPSGSQHLLRFQFDQRVLAQATLARVSWMQGLIERAQREAASSVAEAEASGHLLSQCYVLAEAACPIALAGGDLGLATKSVDKLLSIASSNGLRFWATWGQCIEGALLIERGEPFAGLQALRAALGVYRESGWAMRSSGFLAALAAGLAHTGQVSGALAIADEALAQGERNGEQWCLAELLRIDGELILQSGGADAESRAAEIFVRAVEYAKAQGSLFWELRASLALARLRRRQGQHERARSILEPVYARFTEGFASTDLVAARALLAGEA
jgi:predicted ATPase/DNA-binding winged helix-turn-helix (wHTH) protein